MDTIVMTSSHSTASQHKMLLDLLLSSISPGMHWAWCASISHMLN